jgi:hypothetical protein
MTGKMLSFVLPSWFSFSNLIPFSIASGGQGALFEKTAPWTPAKAFV